MPTDPCRSSGRIRFGDFEVDVRSHELQRAGRRIRLQEKSFLVLHSLLQRPGDVVTRQELAAALWPSEYFVDAEHGLNTAVRRLREALGDSAEQARYVETLPKVGYRFVGAIEIRTEPVAPPAPADPASASAGASTPASARPAESSTAALAESAASAASPAPRPRPTTPAIRRGARVGAALGVAGVLAIVGILATRPPSPATQEHADSPAPPPELDRVGELLARGRYLRNHKRFAEGKQFVEEALRLDPGNPDALGGLALGLNAEGKHEQARAAAQRALELDPNAWEAHRALGVLARMASDFAGAERHFRRSVDAFPGDHKSRNRLARHLLECGRFDEAREHILETRRVAPDDPDVQNIWMDYALRTGDYESAIQQGEIWTAIWEEQIERHRSERSLSEPGASRTTVGVREILGLAYLGARRYEEAVAQFRLVDPKDDLRAALVSAHAGRADEARAILEGHERAVAAASAAADPGGAGAMAMVYIVLGDFERAFAHLDRQLAARWYPGWLNCRLFHAIRESPEWSPFAERLEREFFRGKEAAPSPLGVGVVLVQAWPRPAPALPSPR